MCKPDPFCPADEKLREGEMRYRTLVDNIPAVTYVAALDEDSTPLFLQGVMLDITARKEVEATLGRQREGLRALYSELSLAEERERRRIAADLHDGIGFNAAGLADAFSRTGGFGFFNLRERIQHVGGTLNLRTAPGQGTCVTLEAPLRGDAGGHPPERGGHGHPDRSGGRS